MVLYGVLGPRRRAFGCASLGLLGFKARNQMASRLALAFAVCRVLANAVHALAGTEAQSSLRRQGRVNTWKNLEAMPEPEKRGSIKLKRR